jgi:hypothetical protein
MPGDRNDFLRLAPTRYTIQVARATTRDALQPPPGMQPCHIVELGAPPQRQYLLLCGDHADATSARTATIAAGVAGWPRRIGPLQDEVRRID